MVSLRSVAKYGGLAVLVLVGLVVLGFLLGFLGVPAVDAVENRFGPVNDSTTVVETDLVVSNPNPIGIRLGDSNVNYTVFMNDLSMAHGNHDGLGIGSGQSTVNFTSYLRNERIPAWWYTHVDNGEVTDVLVDADLTLGFLFGQTLNIEQSETIETDILGSFNSSETRAINASQPLVEDPVLYLNGTNGTYGANVTREQTPIDTTFTVYNPKPWAYTVTEIGYQIRMNGVPVGSGSTEDPYAIPPGSEQTLRATTVIDNSELDDWWVTHLQNDQVTNLTIDFSIVVDPQAGDVLGDVDPIQLDVDRFDYNTTIETDIFGNKNETNGSGADGAVAGGSGGGDGEATATADGQTTTDGDVTTESSTETPAETDAETTTTGGTTTTDDGLFPTDDDTTTDDGGLLS